MSYGYGLTRRRIVRRNPKTGEWEILCRIHKLLSTDSPRVKTAVLVCGAEIRFDLDAAPRGAGQNSVLCPTCTKTEQEKKGGPQVRWHDEEYASYLMRGKDTLAYVMRDNTGRWQAFDAKRAMGGPTPFPIGRPGSREMAKELADAGVTG